MAAFSSSAFSVAAFSESAFDFGSVAVEETPSGGSRYGGRKRRRTEAFTGPSRTVSPDGTLYRQMFPNQPVEPTAVEPTPPNLRALLAAWMLFEDD